MSLIKVSAETFSSKIDYNQRTDDSTMGPKVLVSEQDIIATYAPEDQVSCKQYVEYRRIIEENPSFGYKRCAKLLGVSQGRTRWWHTKGAKKAVPMALKTVEKLKGAGFIPFTEKHEHAKAIFNILGTLFGDGGIDKRLNTMAFISSDKRDVDLWEQDLLNVFSFSKNKTNLVEGGEWGHSYNIRTFDRNIIRFFVALGTPVGNKVSTEYCLPENIFSLPWRLRRAFLDGLLASEVSVPSFRSDGRWDRASRFTNFALGLSKIDALEEEHKLFLVELKKLCVSVGLGCTQSLRKETSKITRRKDGHYSCCYRIFFQTHFDKILRFNKHFQLRYAANKKERLGKEIEFALKYKENLGVKVTDATEFERQALI